MSRSIRIPASTANLGPGFDALSFALQIYLKVEIEPASAGPETRVVADGVDSEKIPGGADNLIVRVLERVAERRRRRLEPVTLKVDNEIPLARGMGSSSAAIVAGISCYEALSGESLTVDEIFEYAYEFESHPDNLAASLFGGLMVSATLEGGRAVFSKIDVPVGVVPVLVIPEFELQTAASRAVLPETYTRADVVFNIQRSALVVAAVANGRWDLLAEAMRDRVHQPYRAPLIPGLEDVLALGTEGLRGAALSGAGPTVMALAAPESAAAVGDAIVRVFNEHGVAASARVTKIDTEGRSFIQQDKNVRERESP